jgi:hypothetical protein
MEGKVATFRKHHNVNMYGEVEVELHTFFISALDAGEWSTSCCSHFTAMETSPIHPVHIG